MLDKLKRYCKDHKGPGQHVIVVGYSMEYALEVHERTDVKRRVGGPKFLEKAARENAGKIRDLIRRTPIEQQAEALLRSGLLIQRESQLNCPVDTSALRASAFTTIEKDLDRVATEARSKAEAIRIAGLKRKERSKK